MLVSMDFNGCLTKHQSIKCDKCPCCGENIQIIESANNTQQLKAKISAMKRELVEKCPDQFSEGYNEAICDVLQKLSAV